MCRKFIMRGGGANGRQEILDRHTGCEVDWSMSSTRLLMPQGKETRTSLGFEVLYVHRTVPNGT
jgi:hypothetical protein